MAGTWLSTQQQYFPQQNAGGGYQYQQNNSGYYNQQNQMLQYYQNLGQMQLQQQQAAIASQQNQRDYMNGIMQQYRDAQNSANAANEGRYNEGRDMLRSRYNRIMGRLDDQGKYEADDINERSNAQLGTTEQDLISRGLGNTTVRSSMLRGVERDRTRELGGLRERNARLQSDYDERLSGDEVGFLERRTDSGPDLNGLLQIMDRAGAGGVGGGGFSAFSGSSGASMGGSAASPGSATGGVDPGQTADAWGATVGSDGNDVGSGAWGPDPDQIYAGGAQQSGASLAESLSPYGGEFNAEPHQLQSRYLQDPTFAPGAVKNEDGSGNTYPASGGGWGTPAPGADASAGPAQYPASGGGWGTPAPGADASAGPAQYPASGGGWGTPAPGADASAGPAQYPASGGGWGTPAPGADASAGPAQYPAPSAPGSQYGPGGNWWETDNTLFPPQNSSPQQPANDPVTTLPAQLPAQPPANDPIVPFSQPSNQGPSGPTGNPNGFGIAPGRREDSVNAAELLRLKNGQDGAGSGARGGDPREAWHSLNERTGGYDAVMARRAALQNDPVSPRRSTTSTPSAGNSQSSQPMNGLAGNGDRLMYPSAQWGRDNPGQTTNDYLQAQNPQRRPMQPAFNNSNQKNLAASRKRQKLEQANAQINSILPARFPRQNI